MTLTIYSDFIALDMRGEPGYENPTNLSWLYDTKYLQSRSLAITRQMRNNYLEGKTSNIIIYCLSSECY